MSRIRIIAGHWRSRMINVADAQGLRPTPDAVREKLFNWLGQDLTGLRCLDLFAGTGALGLEAASRGASHVTFVEQNRKVFRHLQDEVKALGNPATGVVLELCCADAVEFVQDAAQNSAAAYDVVFLDPPYHQGWLQKIEPYLASLLAPDAWVYAEAEQPIEQLAGLSVIKSGKAGQVYYHVLAKPEA